MLIHTPLNKKGLGDSLTRFILQRQHFKVTVHRAVLELKGVIYQFIIQMRRKYYKRGWSGLQN